VTQRPLTSTVGGRALGEDDLPTGQQMIVMIGKLDNYGIEDAIVINQRCVDFGAFRSLFERRYVSSVKVTATDQQQFGRADPTTCSQFRAGDKAALNPLTGTPDPGTELAAGACVIGKYATRKLKSSRNDPDAKGHEVVDQSTITRKPGVSVVDHVRMSVASDGSTMATVGTRQERILKVGDKLTDRHAQKGCVAEKRRPEDMPCTRDGMTPDVCVSPDQFPSRMTVAKIIEMLAGKLAALKGEVIDLTPFRDLGDFAGEIMKHGYHWSCKEVMFDPITGRKMQNPVAIGIVDYAKLKHMVDDKAHSRREGPMLPVLQQPVEGRGRDGALRLGEMERDTLLAHGAAAVLNDRLHKCSDGKEFVICGVCSEFAEALPDGADGKGTEAHIDDEWWYCRACAAMADADTTAATAPVAKMALPQAMYLMKQYLGAMQIGLGFEK